MTGNSTKALVALALIALVFAVAAQCSAGIAKADALEHLTRGDALADIVADMGDALEVERRATQALRDTTDALRTTTAIEVAAAQELGRKAVERADAIRQRAEELAGDSVAAVMAITQLGQIIDSLHASAVKRDSLHDNALRIVWQRVDQTDALLAAEVRLRKLSDAKGDAYRAGAERAMEAIAQHERRDKLLGGAGVLLLIVAAVR